MLRTNLPALIERLARRAGVRDLAMTTNGILLAPMAPALKAAGLGRRHGQPRHAAARALRRADPPGRARPYAGRLEVAARDFPGLKIDTVVLRGVNDDEIADLLAFARARGAEIRFIEYMDVGGATGWTAAQVVSRDEILERIASAFGPIAAAAKEPSAPADRFRLPDGTPFGVIASTTAPFCRDCDRARLTADGVLYLCLYATRGLDLRGPIRAGASDAELSDSIAAHLGSPHRPRRRAAPGHAGTPPADPGELAQAGPALRNAHPRRLDASRGPGDWGLGTSALPHARRFASSGSQRRCTSPAFQMQFSAPCRCQAPVRQSLVPESLLRVRAAAGSANAYSVVPDGITTHCRPSSM